MAAGEVELPKEQEGFELLRVYLLRPGRRGGRPGLWVLTFDDLHERFVELSGIVELRGVRRG